MAFDQEPNGKEELGKEIDAHLETHPELVAAKAPAVMTAPQSSMTAFGLEGIPTSMIGIPRVKLVQPVSQNVELATGNDATPGTFHFSDSMTSRDSVTIAMLTAKHSFVEFQQEDGTVKPTERVGILFKDMETGRMYVTDLSVTSFNAFGKLMGLVASEEWENAWDKQIVLTSEKKERQGGGKYFTVKFTVGDKLPDDKSAEMAQLYAQYGGYFTHEETEPEAAI